MEARRRKASALRLRFSQSLANLPRRLSQARVRSTIHRFGDTTKALALKLYRLECLLSLAQYSDTASAPVQACLSFPRACLARARNPESSAWTGENTGILRAAATRENDRVCIQQEPHFHYIRQLSIGTLSC
jgi:hypothetical protein